MIYAVEPFSENDTFWQASAFSPETTRYLQVEYNRILEDKHLVIPDGSDLTNFALQHSHYSGMLEMLSILLTQSEQSKDSLQQLANLQRSN